MNFNKAIELYLGFKPNLDNVELRDDGDGIYISKWEYDIEQPTIEQLEALKYKVELIQEQEYIIEQGKNTMQSLINLGVFFYNDYSENVAEIIQEAKEKINLLKT